MAKTSDRTSQGYQEYCTLRVIFDLIQSRSLFIRSFSAVVWCENRPSDIRPSLKSRETYSHLVYPCPTFWTNGSTKSKNDVNYVIHEQRMSEYHHTNLQNKKDRFTDLRKDDCLLRLLRRFTGDLIQKFKQPGDLGGILHTFKGLCHLHSPSTISAMGTRQHFCSQDFKTDSTGGGGDFDT